MGMIEETIYRFTLTAADRKLTVAPDGERLRLRFDVIDWLAQNGKARLENAFFAIIIEFNDVPSAVHFKMRFVEGDDSIT
jgi:hypothetical protein